MQGVSLVYLEAGEEIERIAAAQSGDRQAYLALVRQYARPLYRLAYAMCGDADAADLLARDALICGWGELREIPDSLRFFPWILGIMRRIHETPSAVATSPKATETRPIAAIDAHGAELSPTNGEHRPNPRPRRQARERPATLAFAPARSRRSRSCGRTSA